MAAPLASRCSLALSLRSSSVFSSRLYAPPRDAPETETLLRPLFFASDLPSHSVCMLPSLRTGQVFLVTLFIQSEAQGTATSFRQPDSIGGTRFEDE